MERRLGSMTLLRFLALSTIILAGGMFLAWYCLRWTPSHTGPSWSHLGMPHEPFTVLVMGTDISYLHSAPRVQRGDPKSFSGRSDTMMLIMVDPQHRTIKGINIPRDSVSEIPGHGKQKVNAANAIGGPLLAKKTVAKMLGVEVNHSMILNVQGFVDAINEVGGVTVEVPKKMSYMDWTAKLKIDLESGVHTLNGNQAMGFVRFRHDDMGDIGRIQRQQIFLHAMINKLLNPLSWPHFPHLTEIAKRSMLTDMSDAQLLQTFNFVRSIPRNQIQFTMLPGRFGDSGSWVPDRFETSRLIDRLYGAKDAPQDRRSVTISLKNVSSFPALAVRMANLLRRSGYAVAVNERPSEGEKSIGTTRIIAQRGNYDEAQMVRSDLGNHGEIINASIGDIYSSITVLLADDLEPMMRMDIAAENSTQYH